MLPRRLLNYTVVEQFYTKLQQLQNSSTQAELSSSRIVDSDMLIDEVTRGLSAVIQ